jgi:serine/threonine protein kinase
MTQLSRHVLETLWEDGDFVLSRSALAGEQVLVLAPASERPAPGIIARLEHTYALRGELEPFSVARPLRLVHHRGLPALLLEDLGGNLLAPLLGRPWELRQFLRVAIGVAVALGRLHARGLIHRDVSPGNILVNLSTGQAWLIGTRFVSRLPGKQIPAPPEEIAGILAYMAPEQTGRMNRSIDARSAGLVFSLDGAYTFLHDRIREAAYSLIPENERAATHLRIGRLLVSSATSAAIEEEIFEIVNQLNRAGSLIKDLEERKRVAEFNLVAGKRAKISEAYASALNYFATSEAFLSEDCWDQDRALAFDVGLNRAECEFRTGLLTQADNRLSMLSERAANHLDDSAVSFLRVALYMTQVRFDRAVEVGIEYLRHVGVEWSPHPTKDDVGREYTTIWRQVGARAIEQLVDLPLTDDPDCRATLDVLSVFATPAWFADENLHDLVVAKMVNLSLERGNSDGSCYAYALLGAVLGSTLGQYQTGFRFGKLALDLVEKRGLDRFKGRVYSCLGHHILPWTQHLHSGRVWNRLGFSAAKESGDLTFAAFSCSNMVANLLAGGDPLEEVQREAENGLQFARKMQFGLVSDYITAQLRLVRTLRGLTPKFGSFNDAEFDESQFEQHLEGNPRLAMAACRYWIRKLQARFYADDLCIRH